jgi:hypothetical protein
MSSPDGSTQACARRSLSRSKASGCHWNQTYRTMFPDMPRVYTVVLGAGTP